MLRLAGMLYATWWLILLTAFFHAASTLAAEPSGNFSFKPEENTPPLVIDIVIPVAPKDLTVLRFTLRHALKYAQHLRNVYLVSIPTQQLESIALQASTHYTTRDQHIIIIDEAEFPFSIKSIRAYLRQARPNEGYDGQPFDGVVVTPQKCPDNIRGMQQSQMIHACRQRYANETSPEQLGTAKWGQIKMETFDRAGWMFQQFLKLGCNRDIIPGLSDAYWVLDSDTILFNEYSPFPPNSDGNNLNYLPGDGRDCGNPPYYMTLNALKIDADWKGSSYGCNGKGVSRKCHVRQLCPIAHQMIYSQKVLNALHSHLESIGSGRPWWQTILHEMPTWHTSPFSEYIIYFAWASSKFPETIVVYNETQLGVTHNEIPQSNYMTNAKKLDEACPIRSFARANQQTKEEFAKTYCTLPKEAQKLCETYSAKNHNGALCPVPKYAGFHGFRNKYDASYDLVYKQFDLDYIKHQRSDNREVKL